jgi:tetratricopeptide (TPR) repeat protein
MDGIDALIATETLTRLDPSAAFEHLAALIDGSHDERREDGLLKAVRLGEELLESGLRPEREPLLYYFIGNAWAGLRIIRQTADQNAAWAWEQPEAREEILAYRTAYRHRRFGQLETIRQCQIATNLGNLMSNVGRFVEALDYYDAALSADPNFGMAIGNRGDCLLYYARALYDDGHRAVFARSAVDLIERALSLPLEPGVAPNLSAQRDYALQRAGHTIEMVDRARGEPLGDDPAEIAFRTWALRSRLFLNPLNDLGAVSVAANDVLHLPTMHVAANVGSGFHGFYNQLKQEFAAARCLLYEGLHPAPVRHYADKDVGLLDTWNDTVFGLTTEKVKLAFRLAYSLLDKISVFIARYFYIELPLHKVNIRSVWYMNGQHGKGLLSDFNSRSNWPLRGLFWLSKDLHEWDKEFHQAIEPDAQEVAKLRNQLEHQYARVTDPRLIRRPDEPSPVPEDPFGYVVSKQELAAKSLRMLKTARAALIYLSLAMHQEECQKGEPSSDSAYRGSFPVLR